MFLRAHTDCFFFSFPACGLFLLLGLVNLFYYRFNKHKYKAIILNLRPIRALMFMLAVFAGAIAPSSGGACISFPKVFLAAMSVFFSWEFSVVINDVYDQEIDRISNKGRPLSKGVLSAQEYRRVSLIYAFFALSFAMIINFPIFIASIICILLGIAYSVPPFRFRKNIFGNIIIGLSLVLSFMMGLLLSGTPSDLFDQKNLAFYIILLIFGTVVTFTKDLKDIRGDAEHGIRNIYSVYGREKGKKIVAVFLFFSLVLPIVFICEVFPSITIMLFAAATVYFYYLRENEKEVYLMAAIEGMCLFMYFYF